MGWKPRSRAAGVENGIGMMTKGERHAAVPLLLAYMITGQTPDALAVLQGRTIKRNPSEIQIKVH